MHTKKLILILLATALLATGCETVSQDNAPAETVRVVEAPGIAQDVLYDKIRQWFSQTFVSGDAVVDYESKEAGTIIGNAIGSYGMDFLINEHRMRYNMRVDVRDGRFRVATSIIYHENAPSSGNVPYRITPSKNRVQKAEEYLSRLTDSMRTYALAQSAIQQSDW